VELTPEERDKILAEERARYEARQQLEREAEQARADVLRTYCEICGAVLDAGNKKCPKEPLHLSEEARLRARQNRARLNELDAKESHGLRNTLIAIASLVLLAAIFNQYQGTTSAPGPSSGRSSAPLTGEARALQLKYGWAADDCRTIAGDEIRIGMTAPMVIAAWGRPKDINRTITSYRVHEQWVYRSSYVYLEGESQDTMKVTSIQN
jgi:hypothetical protein